MSLMEQYRQDFEDNRDVVKQMMDDGLGRIMIAKELGISESKAYRWMKKIKDDECSTQEESEAWQENAKLTQSNQKFQDKARISRKILRESNRVDNAVAEYGLSLLELYSQYQLNTSANSHDESDDTDCIAVFHISDPHFNELVRLPNNVYDFVVASKRLQKFASRGKNVLNAFNVGKVLVAITGDVINSDRRLDELLSQAMNRSKASFLAVELLEQFILDINKQYNVVCASVAGNESRMTEQIGYTEELVTDNYDVTVFNTLAYLFKDCEGIKFITGDVSELVVNINGMNILMLHGHTGIGDKKDVEKAVEELKGRYAASQGIVIDYVIFGHKHSAYLSDMFSRCGSLVGANAYSERGLNLSSRASQNLYIIHKDGTIDCMKIDLQNTEGYEGYDINNSLESYNAKSAEMLKDRKVVVEVTI